MGAHHLSGVVSVTLAVLGVALPTLRASAIAPEDGPAFMTDSHGAVGVCFFLKKVTAVDPQSERYYRGALDWLVTTAEWEEDRCQWRVSTTAPPDNPNYGRYSLQGQGRELAEGWVTFGDGRYREAALGALRQTFEEALHVDTPFGDGYWWGKRVGHSHGPGGPGDFLLDLYTMLGESAALPYAEGLLNWLRQESVVSDDGHGNTIAFWPEAAGGTDYESGYCYGNAGTLAFLLSAVETMPGFSWPDCDLLTAANTSLRWLMHVAVDVVLPGEDGVKWYYMRHEMDTNNIGFGSGVAGIGLQLLDGCQRNLDAGNAAFAAECVDYARKAARSIIYRIEEWGSTPPLQVGACGGEGGTAILLFPLADELEAADPAFAQECRDTAGTIADMVVDARLVFPAGSAWKSGPKFGDEAVSIALDYGTTGLGLCLSTSGDALSRVDLIDVAKDAAAYLRFIAVWEENGGCKWPMIIPYGPTDSDGDGVTDERDAFPAMVGEAVDSDEDGMGDQFEWIIVDADSFDQYEDFWDVSPDEDFDEDGCSNIEEFLAGTNPIEAGACLPVGGWWRCAALVAGLGCWFLVSGSSSSAIRSRANARNGAPSGGLHSKRS